jgi:hypothetical protein
MHGAIFSVHNYSSTPIVFEHTWPPHDLEIEINPGDRKSFNTIAADVHKIRWRTENWPNIKSFEVPVTLGFLNLGGWVKIYNNGQYEYYFGVDGSSSGIAQ